MIKPDAYLNIGKIISVIEKSGLSISNLRLTKMSQKDAEGEPINKLYYSFLSKYPIKATSKYSLYQYYYSRNYLIPSVN